MINAFTIGTSAILAGQTALNVLGQNIANAANPGYHLQAPNLVNSEAGNATPTGVDVASITRYTNDPVRAAIIVANGDQGQLNARLSVRQQIENTLGSGTGGIGDQLNSFFNQITQLTTQPASIVARQPLVATASNLAQQINSAAGAIDNLRSELGQQITSNVAQVNTYASQIANLNDRIAAAEQQGTQPNDLLDQRDTLINSLSQLVDVKTVNQPYGVVNVLSSDAAIVTGNFANTFKVAPDASGNLAVTENGLPQPIAFNSGSLSGQLQEYNTDIPATRAKLDTWTNQLIGSVNEVQATGLGLNGPLSSTTGTVSASSSTVPLNSANLPFPVNAGQLTVSVTDSSGNRTNTTININPTTQSLQAVATALNGVTGLSASVNASNQLQIQAQAGYKFDFAGRDTNPPGGGAVANPDTAGILSALGINGFFSGSDASSIAVNPAIVADPSLVAGSKSGQPGDTTNLQKFAAIQNQQLVSGQTLSDNFANQAASVGSDVQSLADQQTVQTNLVQSLNNQEQSVTGVDTNQELAQLLNYQRMIQGASEFMSTVNTALDSILTIIK